MKTPGPLLLLALFLSACIFHLHSITAVDSPTSEAPSNGTDFIRTSCGVTLYPDLCYTTLSAYASSIQQNPAQLALVAISVSLSEAKNMAAYVANLSREADYGSDSQASAALHDCFSNFGDAVEEISGSLKQMRQVDTAGSSKESFRFQMSNVQTWMSAALTDEDTCTDGFEGAEDGPMKKDICDRVDYVKKHTSNALALVNSCADKRMK